MVYTGTCINQQIFPLPDWCLKQGWEKYVLPGADSLYSNIANILFSTFLPEKKQTIAQQYIVRPSQTNFGLVIESMMHHKPDVILSTLPGAQGVHFF